MYESYTKSLSSTYASGQGRFAREKQQKSNLPRNGHPCAENKNRCRLQVPDFRNESDGIDENDPQSEFRKNLKIGC